MEQGQIPENPIVLRRKYLECATKVATRNPNEEDVADLIALTQAFLRVLCDEPRLCLLLEVPGVVATSNITRATKGD